MYHPLDFNLDWTILPLACKSFLLFTAVVLAIYGWRFLTIARALGWRTRPKLMPSSDSHCGFGLGALEGLALRNTLRRDSYPMVAETGPRAVRALEVAGHQFRYLFSRCMADVQAAKRLSLLVVMLGLAVTFYDAFVLYGYFFNNSNRTGFTAMLFAAEQLSQILAIGLFCPALLYGVAGALERALVQRSAAWSYVFEGVKAELAEGSGISDR